MEWNNLQIKTWQAVGWLQWDQFCTTTSFSKNIHWLQISFVDHQTWRKVHTGNRGRVKPPADHQTSDLQASLQTDMKIE